MPLQNRVDPFGKIHAVPERGLFTGNRGVIHDPATKTLLARRWASKAWIICVCEFKGMRREVMGRNTRLGNAGWTELFFLDEVTALAAGHRPCFHCRRDRATDFLDRYRATSGDAGARAPDLDGRLHAERLAAGAAPVDIDRHDLARLPDGAMVSDGAASHAIRRGRALRWSFAGYDRPVDLDAFGTARMRILTPATTLAVLAGGYRPAWHPSGEALTG